MMSGNSKEQPCAKVAPAEVCIRIASAMEAIARLNRIWLFKTISFASMFKVYKSLVTSTVLCGYETWTRLADSEKRI